MGRFRQPAGHKGSLRWIQKLVNEHPNILDSGVGLGPIDWRSPRAADDFAEYRDEAFLDKLDVTLPKVALPKFWPARGPQWDALGRAQSGHVILVEAKAHISEIMSSSSQASPDSLAKIRKTLTATASALHAKPGLDWAVRFYQYTNRLAHAHLLHTLNRVCPASTTCEQGRQLHLSIGVTASGDSRGYLDPCPIHPRRSWSLWGARREADPPGSPAVHALGSFAGGSPPASPRPPFRCFAASLR